MNKFCFVIPFATFGSPNGFEQSVLPYPPGQNQSNSSEEVKHIKENIKSFDLKTSAIQLFPNDKIYSIRKYFINEKKIITYSVYIYAKEKNSSRNGTFIGISLLFFEQVPQENITIKYLNEFSNYLRRNYVQNDIIQVNNPKDFKIKVIPKDFDKILFNLKEVDSEFDDLKNTGQSLVVYCRTEQAELQKKFAKSIDLLNIYDTIYFTKSENVIKFVQQKNIFKAIDEKEFYKRIESLQAKKRQEIQNLIKTIEGDKRNLKEYQTKTTQDFNNDLSKTKEKHRRNEQKIKENEQKHNKFKDYYEKLNLDVDNIIKELDKERNIKTATQKFNKWRKLYQNFIKIKQKSDVPLEAIEDILSRIDIETPQSFSPHITEHEQTKKRTKREKQLIISIFIAPWVIVIFISVWLFSVKGENKDIKNELQSVKTQKQEFIKDIDDQIKKQDALVKELKRTHTHIEEQTSKKTAEQEKDTISTIITNIKTITRNIGNEVNAYKSKNK